MKYRDPLNKQVINVKSIYRPTRTLLQGKVISLYGPTILKENKVIDTRTLRKGVKNG